MSELLVDFAVLEELERRLGQSVVRQILTVHFKHSGDLCRHLRAAADAPSAETVGRIVHQLAGSSGSLGLLRLGHRAIEIERDMAAAPIASLPALMAELVGLVEASNQALASVYPGL